MPAGLRRAARGQVRPPSSETETTPYRRGQILGLEEVLERGAGSTTHRSMDGDVRAPKLAAPVE